MAVTDFPNGLSTSTLTATTVTATIVGNVTGNLTGNVTGNVTGGIVHPVVNLSADGAITVPSVDTVYKFTKAGVAAMTLAAPSSIDGVRLTFIATTAQANTITATGILNASSSTATWGGAIGDTLELVAMGVKWMVIATRNVTIT